LDLGWEIIVSVVSYPFPKGNGMGLISILFDKDVMFPSQGFV